MPDPDALAGRLTEDGHELLQRVYFEDTDFSGRVYHARYLHFMERGRSDYLRLLGIHHHTLAADGLAFAVRHLEVDFFEPAGIDDVLTIRSRRHTVSGARIVLQQTIRRGEACLVSARVTVALVGPSGRPLRLPPVIRAAFGAPALSAGS